jgi:L-ascorbate metabolism protein UlaG (beta-lactamase superfamily)
VAQVSLETTHNNEYREGLKVSIEMSPSKHEVLFVWFNRDFKNVDAVFITHEHYDNMYTSLISEAQKQTPSIVVADSTSAKKIRHLVPPKKLPEVKSASEVKFSARVLKVCRRLRVKFLKPKMYQVSKRK